MRIVSWNVNGLRACHRKGFLDWLEAETAEIVALQEVRAQPDQLPQALREPDGWHCCFAAAERKGYSGVGLYSRSRPDTVDTSLGLAELDCEGRLQHARFGALHVVNVYFPNGSGKGRDNSRVDFKLRFYRRLFDRLAPHFDRGERILVLGDFNTAHREIDLARPKQNQQTSGFLPEEREEIDRWLEAGWVDTFRHFEQGPDWYTWWSQRWGVRERNVGWRIDYVLASPGAMPFLREASIHTEVRGSDHCPISVAMAPDVRYA